MWWGGVLRLVEKKKKSDDRMGVDKWGMGAEEDGKERNKERTRKKEAYLNKLFVKEERK